MGNTFGHLFRITTFGESHGGGVGVIIDGCPPRLLISPEEIQLELNRRRPGQSKITTPRKEADTCEILSGVFEGKTLGTPIMILVRNQDHRSQDYDEMADKYRPSHADATYDAKYGIRNWQGGGRSSARETIGRVAAGAIAKKILRQSGNIEIIAYVKRIKDLEAVIDPREVTFQQVESNMVRCPHSESALKMIALIEHIRDQGDSLGGVVECVVRNLPKGLGSPVFDKLEADLAKAVMSLPATKGFEIGSGFAGTFMTGSEHNDEFYIDSQGTHAPSPIILVVFRGVFPMGKNYCYALLLSPLPPFVNPSVPSPQQEKKQPYPLRGVMTHVFSLAPYPWLKRWWH
jgi:chorismate synthase